MLHGKAYGPSDMADVAVFGLRRALKPYLGAISNLGGAQYQAWRASSPKAAYQPLLFCNSAARPCI